MCNICLIPACQGCSPFVSAGTMPVPAVTPTKEEANSHQVGGSHYRKVPNAPQHWDFVLAHGIPYMEAQIIKYVMRWRDKGGIQDLEKAKHFLEKLIEHESLTGKQVHAPATEPPLSPPPVKQK